MFLRLSYFRAPVSPLGKVDYRFCCRSGRRSNKRNNRRSSKRSSKRNSRRSSKRSSKRSDKRRIRSITYRVVSNRNNVRIQLI